MEVAKAFVKGMNLFRRAQRHQAPRDCQETPRDRRETIAGTSAFQASSREIADHGCDRDVSRNERSGVIVRRYPIIRSSCFG
jgi:hypothetical protein